MEDILITGMGIACPLGIGGDAVWSAIEARRSGVRLINRLVEAGHAVPIGGEVPDFEPKQYIKPRKSLKVMSRETQLGFTAAELAWENAALESCALDPERVGVVLGTNVFRSEIGELAALYETASENGQFAMAQWGAGMREMYPLWMLKYLPNMTSCHIGIAHDARGPINTMVLAEVSSLLAIIEAVGVIARGSADVMIAGGASSQLGMVDLAWHGGSRLSHQISDPARACRPFDAARDGAVGSEGAALFVLESRAHASRRGAHTLARVLGYGRCAEPCAPRQNPTGEAIGRAIEAALAMGGVPTSEVGHVNAHGLATIEDDALEARAIEQTLGDVPVTAPKSFFGNLGAAGGAAELVVSLLGLQQGLVPPTLNYEQPDPACPVQVVATPQPARSPAVLALNHRATGQAVSLLVSAEP